MKSTFAEKFLAWSAAPLFLAAFLPAIFPDFNLYPYAAWGGIGNSATGFLFVFAAVNAVIA